MCFSANASFSSGIILTIAGIVSIRKTNTLAQVAFASIPFIFAIQQFSEGFVWLSLTNLSYSGVLQPATFLFLIFAHIVWPVWIPFSILLIENNMKRRNMLYLLLGCGLVLASYYAYCLGSLPVTVTDEGYHLKYVLPYPAALFFITSIFYGLATVLPAFISSIKRMKWLGISITLSYIFTSFFYQEYITSVWCYFAAILSMIIYWILHSVHQLSFTISGVKVKTSP